MGRAILAISACSSAKTRLNCSESHLATGFAASAILKWVFLKSGSLWIVNLLACGLSTAMNSTPESMSVAMNAKLRDRRSSLAMTSLALCFLQAVSAFSNSGLSFRFPLSISVNSAIRVHRPHLNSAGRIPVVPQGQAPICPAYLC